MCRELYYKWVSEAEYITQTNSQSNKQLLWQYHTFLISGDRCILKNYSVDIKELSKNLFTMFLGRDGTVITIF